MTLKTIKPEPNADLVASISDLLESAKNGEVQAAAIAVLDSNRQLITLWDRGTTPIVSLLGAVESLKLEVWTEGFEHD